MQQTLQELINEKSLRLKSTKVDVENLDVRLTYFLSIVAPVHKKMFGKPLVITSGNDGGHSPVSAHYKNRAVDLRTWDKDDAQNVVWASYLASTAPKLGVVVQDERAKFWSPHTHAWVFESVLKERG